jgi:nucleotide-binding universal stress UspA family protein
MIPPRTILAAVDFSETSKTALALAARLARHSGAALHVLHVQDPLLSIAARHEGIDLARDTDDALQRFVTSAWPAVECSPQCHTVTGAVRETILDIAHRVQAQLLVVGARGMSRAERLVFGSTTEEVLRRADVSMLVVPTGWTPPRADASDLSGVGPVVVGVDLSDPSVEVVKAACELASMLDTSLSVVSVVPELTVLSGWHALAMRAVHDRVAAARQELQVLIDGLACSVPVEIRVEPGAVPNQLAEAAAPAPGRTPILVLGKKAAGGKGSALGAIAHRVLARTSVPVLMNVPTL